VANIHRRTFPFAAQAAHGTTVTELPRGRIQAAAGDFDVAAARRGQSADGVLDVGLHEHRDPLGAGRGRGRVPAVARGARRGMSVGPSGLTDDARRFDASPAWLSIVAAGRALPWLTELDRTAVEAL